MRAHVQDFDGRHGGVQSSTRGLRAFALDVQRLLRQAGTRELEPLLREVMPIVSEVTGRMIEINARRAVRAGFTAWRPRQRVNK